MAKGKVKFPLDRIDGTIAGPDRTIGRDVGLASSIRQVVTARSGTKQPRLTSQLYATTAPTRGGSQARHTRSQVYCECDGAYKLLSPAKYSYLEPYWMAVTEGGFVHMGGYQVYMKICLKGLAEYDAFLRFSYVQRYRIWNNSDHLWIDEEVILKDIPTFQPDGMDLEVYLLLSKTTKKGNITYDPLMIDYRLEHEVTERGKATTWIPDVQTQSSVLVDVYSYYKPVG